MKLPKLPDIGKMFSAMPKNNQMIVSWVLAGLFVFLVARLIIFPVYERMVSLDKQIREKKAGIKKSMSILAQKDEIANESATYSSLLEKIALDEKDISALLKEIESMAEKSSVNLVDIKPQGFKQDGAFKVYQVSLTCEAQMEPLAAFMYELENSPFLLLVNKYQISPKTRDSSVAACSLVVYKIIK